MMHKNTSNPAWFLGALLTLCLAARGQTTAPLVDPREHTDLSGEWRFAMDRDDVGTKDAWFNKALLDRIKLPGILQSQGYGDEIRADTPWVQILGTKPYLTTHAYDKYKVPGNVKVPFLSQPIRHYLGVAWHQRDIDIPEEWDGKRVQLFLERPRWETDVWIDDQPLGSNNSLVAPHEFELGKLTPGKHRLSIRIDNRMLLPYRPDGHSVSDAEGSTWNGIAGKIELTATAPVWLDDVQIYPDVQKKTARVVVEIGTITGAGGLGTLHCGNVDVPAGWGSGGARMETTVQLPADTPTWDEFHPNLQTMNVSLDAPGIHDARTVTFGLREIVAQDRMLLLNGRQIEIRGTHSGGDFPLTGYPATDVASWKRIFQTCKDYGLNAMRFHSWCPPDEAFTAADELGFYIQPECGMWNPFNVDSPISKMLELETARLLKAYGNHPSLILLSPSNEPAGRYAQVLIPWTIEWYKKDPRRLYAEDTGRASPTAEGPQFLVLAFRGPRGWFGHDYSSMMRNVKMPAISHEVGQYCAYPDFSVINKFTGYLQPGNYEIFRDSAREHGVLDRNKEFAWASGKFQLASYKEEIEANRRTKELSGFELLDLHDYLGQGTALIGVLDTFWESKGYASAEEYRRFAGPVAPLARMTDHIFRNADTLDVPCEIAQFSDSELKGAVPSWRIVDQAGHVAAEGKWEARDIPRGKNIPLGTVHLDLKALKSPAQYKLVVDITGSHAENEWDFWLYPDTVATEVPADVLVTNLWADAKQKLAAGGKVLFTPKVSDLNDLSPPLNNVPIFWNRVMNPKLEAMLGLWIDAKNPALANFPTEAFCNWQWTDIVRGMRAVNIEKAPPSLRPIVSAIDDWNRNYKLGVIFEAKVGDGRLLVCAPDIQSDLDHRTVARQLRRSLLDYAASDKFDPQVTMTAAEADALWPGPTPTNHPASAPATSPDIQEGPNAAPRVR